MKTNNLMKTFVGAGALAFALSLNFKYASNDYGILDNTLSVRIFASGSGSNSGSSSGGESSGEGESAEKDYEKKVTQNGVENVIRSCNTRTHTRTVQTGTFISCEGKGKTKCEPRFIPSSSGTPEKSTCPGETCDWR